MNLPNMLERKGGIFLQCERGEGEPIASVRGESRTLPNMSERRVGIFLERERGEGVPISSVRGERAKPPKHVREESGNLPAV